MNIVACTTKRGAPFWTAYWKELDGTQTRATVFPAEVKTMPKTLAKLFWSVKKGNARFIIGFVRAVAYDKNGFPRLGSMAVATDVSQSRKRAEFYAQGTPVEPTELVAWEKETLTPEQLAQPKPKAVESEESQRRYPRYTIVDLTNTYHPIKHYKTAHGTRNWLAKTDRDLRELKIRKRVVTDEGCHFTHWTATEFVATKAS